MTDNSFIREVDEAVRQERYRALWDRFGVYVIGLAVALIVGAAAYNIWKYVQESEAETAGDAFTAAVALKNANEQEKATEAFEELVKDGPSGYAILSRFQLASSQAKAGETDKAVESYEALAKDRRVDAILKGLATLQAATLRLDQADYAEMQKRLDGLASGKSAWRFSAKELLGLSAYQNGDLKAAEDQFSALLVDAGTPRNMRDRANVLLALIVSQTATAPDTKADDTKSGDAGAGDAKSDDAEASEATTN
ncbi:tetratricopeptide repeat protein [Methyloceanibacter caenitepidi]|uniref:Mlr7403 protein n=1 Tax=Methyloceanibacter caenitepidi TaxID=1384459 RepID=A0A0A8K7B2_9HYPH|nr:tetratricopeptide repeat protein [Methyloceanibacter caenitepidi]BAQ17859.1 Mlr7403 protein [Methyloceanibacter caenitepidi]